MRLVGTFQDNRKAQLLSSLLKEHGIENQLEVITNSDWGSSDYGTQTFYVWVVEEDDMAVAMEWVQKFEADPENTQLQNFEKKIPLSKPLGIKIPIGTKPKMTSKGTMGPITLYLLITCVILFFIAEMTTPPPQKLPGTNSSYQQLPSIDRTLMYDYPKTFELLDRYVKLYGVEKQIPEGNHLLQEINETPYWQGLYEKIVNHFKNLEAPWSFSVPMFEKIKQGEVWRLFTPCLLHANLLHIFFNMIWLILLGKQIEQRLQPSRYLLLIVIAAIVTNTIQYLMSGFQFLGFSGVVCAMLAFIWMRQKIATWEGYQLHPSTYSFITFFILIILGIQLISFFMEIRGNHSFSSGIANSAHIAGAICGLILGKLNYFSMKDN